MKTSVYTTSPLARRHQHGFSVPLLLLALIAGLLAWTVTIDKVQNTAVQARISEAEATAATVMAALQQHCARPAATLAQQPYSHVEAPDSFIADLRIAGTCAAPELTIAMRNTHALPVEPVFAFNGVWAGDRADARSADLAGDMLVWTCRETAGTGAAFVPDQCRG